MLNMRFGFILTLKIMLNRIRPQAYLQIKESLKYNYYFYDNENLMSLRKGLNRRYCVFTCDTSSECTRFAFQQFICIDFKI